MEFYFSKFWKLRSPRSRHQHGCILVRAQLLVWSWPLVSSYGGRTSDLSGASLITSLIPFMRTSPSLNHLPKAPHWGLQFQNKTNQIKIIMIISPDWCGSVSWVSSYKPKATGSISVRAHVWVVGQLLIWGRVRGNGSMFLSHSDVYLPLSWSLPSPLSKNK